MEPEQRKHASKRGCRRSGERGAAGSRPHVTGANRAHGLVPSYLTLPGSDAPGRGIIRVGERSAGLVALWAGGQHVGGEDEGLLP